MAKITNLDELMRLHQEVLRFGLSSKQFLTFSTTMLDSFPALYETAKRMNETTGKVVTAANALLTRDDFWNGVQEAGYVLPAEIDNLREAIEPYNARVSGAGHETK